MSDAIVNDIRHRKQNNSPWQLQGCMAKLPYSWNKKVRRDETDYEQYCQHQKSFTEI